MHDIVSVSEFAGNGVDIQCRALGICYKDHQFHHSVSCSCVCTCVVHVCAVWFVGIFIFYEFCTIHMFFHIPSASHVFTLYCVQNSLYPLWTTTVLCQLHFL